MNKKLTSDIIGRNLCFLGLSINTFLYFLSEVKRSVICIGMQNVNSVRVQYSLFSLKIDVIEGIEGSFHNFNTIYNYPLIPIFIGVIYNIYFLVKVYKNESNS